jgi:hypothetical protein
MLLPFAAAAVVTACGLVSGLDRLHEAPTADARVGDDGGDPTNTHPGADGGHVVDPKESPDGAATPPDPQGGYALHLSVHRCSITAADTPLACSRLSDAGLGPTCDFVFAAGTVVTLTTTGFGVFDGWGGSCMLETTQNCNVVMNAEQDASCSYSTGSP